MTPAAALHTWVFDPLAIVAVAAAGWAYARGLGRLWGRAGSGHGIRRGQATAFAVGLGAIVIALLSPLDAVDTTLFSAHMLQHLLLMLVAAPLLVLGRPMAPFAWALPLAWRRGIGRVTRTRQVRAVWRAVTHPVVVWTLNLIVLWAWHLPALYEAALTNDAIHAVEHLCLLGAALLFWQTVCAAHGRRLARGMDVLYVVAAGVQMNILGALITFAGAVWYPSQEGADLAAWGLTPLADQQLAGLIMWVPSSAVYLAATATLFLAWLRTEEAAMQRRERLALVVRD